jgi:integrase/recombinase XerD
MWRTWIWPTDGPGYIARAARSSGYSGRPGQRSYSPASWPAGPAGQCFLPAVAPTRAAAALDLDPVSGRARLSYRRAAELFRVGTGWTLHQLRHSALTHAAEDGTNLPLLLARSRHASVRSLERYARPGPEAVARHLAQTDPARRRP